MTTLVRSDGRVDADTFAMFDADEPMPAEGDVIVSLERWERDREALLQRADRIGVRLASDESPDRIGADLDALDVVALEFPGFRDGRAYSYARLLRDRFGYAGEIRAVGNVLIEQLAFMLRVGFDAFELQSDDAAGDFRAVVDEISVRYQPSGDDQASAIELRHGRA
jgi:uncharacterized protein (DUF934 family)